ncbi:ParA family protein, partial [Acinetobacter baumannii]
LNTIIRAFSAESEAVVAAKIITVFNQKGGCGKTTVSMHIAGTLGLRGARSLLVDMDEQGTATRWAAQASDERPFPASVIGLAPSGGA